MFWIAEIQYLCQTRRDSHFILVQRVFDREAKGIHVFETFHTFIEYLSLSSFIYRMQTSEESKLHSHLSCSFKFDVIVINNSGIKCVNKQARPRTKRWRGFRNCFSLCSTCNSQMVTSKNLKSNEKIRTQAHEESAIQPISRAVVR